MPIHAMAIVDPAAEIHTDAIVGPFCVVSAGVRLEACVELRNHVTVYGRSSIGTGTICFPGAVIGSDPQDLKFKGEDSEVIIGHDCRIHECVTISKGTAGGGMKTVIGDKTLVMAYAHIAHDCILDGGNVIGNNTQLAGHVRVGEGAVVSGMVGVHHFVTIGELAFVAGMSGVRCDVPPYMMVDGLPATPVNVNLVGLRRRHWDDEEIRATRDVFRLLFKDRNGTPAAKVIEEIRALPINTFKGVQRLCSWMETHLEQSVKGRLQESQR